MHDAVVPMDAVALGNRQLIRPLDTGVVEPPRVAMEHHVRCDPGRQVVHPDVVERTVAAEHPGEHDTLQDDGCGDGPSCGGAHERSILLIVSIRSRPDSSVDGRRRAISQGRRHLQPERAQDAVRSLPDRSRSVSRRPANDYQPHSENDHATDYGQPFGWWGSRWTPRDEHSLLWLIERGALDVPTAAFLSLAVESRASLLVVAEPHEASRNRWTPSSAATSLG